MSIRRRISVVLLVLGVSLIVSGCGPGRLFGPTKTPTPTNTPTATITPTSTPLTCPDSISSEISEIIAKALVGVVEDPQRHLACAQLIIDRLTEDANKQQYAKNKSNCDYQPDINSTQAVEDFNVVYGALNDVGAAWLLKGYALDYMGKPDDAQAAYKYTAYNYRCAYIRNQYGGYWSVLRLSLSLIKP